MQSVTHKGYSNDGVLIELFWSRFIKKKGLARFLWENRKISKKERLIKRIHDMFRTEVVIFRCVTIDRKPVLLEFFGVDAIRR